MNGILLYWRGSLIGCMAGVVLGLVVVVVHLHGAAFVPDALYGMVP
jgi:hypothetical protein